jgi:hypothetical protein
MSSTRYDPESKITLKLSRYCQWILPLFISSLLTPLFEQATHCSLIDVDNLGPDTNKLSVKESPPSDWLAFTPSNWIVSVETALDGDAVLIMPTNGSRESKKLE